MKAVVGCWQLWSRELITIRRTGAGLETRSQFIPLGDDGQPSGGAPAFDPDVGRKWRTAWYHPKVPVLEVMCGRHSHHGQICLLQLVDGKVEAQEWAYGPGMRTLNPPHLIRQAFAERCSP